MPSDPLSQIQSRLNTFCREVETRVGEWRQIRDASSFRALEVEVAAMARSVADGIVEPIFKAIVEDPTFQEETKAAARSAGRYRGGEKRPVTVTLLGGGKATVRTPYLKPNRRGQRGRPRGVGKRGVSGVGLYPALAALGIAFGVTPALANEVCRQVADSDSVRCARQALDRRGVDLGHKQTLRVVNAVSRRAVQQRNEWLRRALTEPPRSGPLSGRRVVISTDGGRIRERVPSKQGRRREQTGHRRYATPWREPKLIVVYALEDDGSVDGQMRPVYDGTLGNCDATFSMLAGYLRQLGIHEAQEVILVADGAKWIWERAAELWADVGVDVTKATEVVDWYHALETLYEIAAARKQWSTAERDKWVKTARRLLHKGNVDHLLSHIRAIARGRNATDISKHIDYFDRNRDRMQYASLKKAQRPSGSGAVESMVRRVINMRMKSNGAFWLEDNAEGMILLRSYLKAQRFDDLLDWSSAKAAAWWPENDAAAAPVMEA